jgi:hypothetical protein
MGDAWRCRSEEATCGENSMSVVSIRGPEPRLNAVPRMLYIGQAADEICNILVNHVGRVETAYEQDVQAAFAQLRRRVFDIVVVDQRDDRLATRLILPVLQSLGYPVQPVVISTLKDVGQYLAIPGVARVLAAPVKEAQFLRILGLERRQRAAAPESPAQTPTPQKAVAKKSTAQLVSDSFMRLVSMLYKRAAFVLLFALFIAFSFYGVLIAFFLLSSGWGAPLTLTRGHEMVNKVEREITEVSVALHQTEQRLGDEAFAKVTAEKEFSEAKNLVKYALGTVRKERQSRLRQIAVYQKGVKRLKKVRAQLAGQVGGRGVSGNVEELYKRRLINRDVYSATTMNLIEAGQRLAAVEIEIDNANSRIEEFALSMDMLKSMEVALVEGNSIFGASATASDLLLLAKQSSDALAAMDIARSKLKTAGENTVTLQKSLAVLQDQLAALKTSALARALEKRIDVVFVPYGNERHFAEGKPVQTCAFTIIFCTRAGAVGQSLPGEINSVHPFFGKPIRGTFVEVKLDNPEAAMREIIHGNRKPLFF